jgi:hypothetical protein
MVTGMMTPYDMAASPQSTPCSNREQMRLGQRYDGRTYSPDLRTATEDSLNTYLWRLLDTKNDNVKDYDLVLLTVVSKIETDDEEPRVDFHTFNVGQFSPWIRIRARYESEIKDAWCKAAIIKTPDGRFDTRISPTFFEIDTPFTYPAAFEEEITEEFEYYVPSAFAGAELVPSMADDAVSQADYFFNLEDWDLYMYVFTQSDNIHHLSGFSPTAVEVYQKIDSFIGRIVESMPDNCTLVIASDHGFKQYKYGIDVNNILAGLNLLQWNKQNEVDLKHSLVFHNIWHVYFNHHLITRDELESRGISVPPGSDPGRFLEDYVINALESFTTHDGTPVLRPERCLTVSSENEIPPDLFLGGVYGDYVIDFLGLSTPPRPVAIYELSNSEQWWHARDGIFLVKGRGVRSGFDAGRRNIEDIAPALLYLLGLPVADDIDGNIPYHIFENSYLAGQNTFTIPNYAQVRKDPLPQDIGREPLDKKLRSLGYIR